MNASRIVISACAVIVLVIPVQRAKAQTIACLDEETVDACHTRLLARGRAAVTPSDSAGARRATTVARRLHAKAAGADPGGPAAASAIRDFLPRIAGALFAPTSTGELGDLGLKGNLPISPTPVAAGTTLQGALVFHKASLSPKLLDVVPSARLAGFQRRQERTLGPLADVSISVSSNLETAHWGRNPRPHMQEITLIAQTVFFPQGPMQSSERPSSNAYTDFITELTDRANRPSGEVILPSRRAAGECQIAASADAASLPLTCFTAEVREALVQKIVNHARARADWLKTAQDSLEKTGFYRIAELLNNQPQFNSSLEVRPRARVAGPTEWTGTGRLEIGFKNYNGMRASCRGPVNADCLQKYLDRADVRSSLARSDRIWLQGDWKRRQAWNVSFPADSVRISLGTASTYAVSGGYGAYFGREEDGDKRDRFDVKGNWDIARGDQLRQNRFVATAFLTHRLSDQSTVLLGGTYANRAEFVGDVTSHLGANFGLTYKINPPEKK